MATPPCVGKKSRYIIINLVDLSHPWTWTLLALFILERSVVLKRLDLAASIHPAVIGAMPLFLGKY